MISVSASVDLGCSRSFFKVGGMKGSMVRTAGSVQALQSRLLRFGRIVDPKPW